MPDGSNMKPAQQKQPELDTEERANRLHALVVALYHMQPEFVCLRMSEGEAVNIRGNLTGMAVDETRALLATIS